MSHLGTLLDYRFSDLEEAKDDIRGSKICGAGDEKLGKVDDVIFDHSTGQIEYVVMDTGGWLSSKKFVVPPQALRPSVQHEDDFTVDLTQEQIESFPPYNEADIDSDEKWADYDGRYRSQWKQNR
jgi:sporulation protein YlmC with PRC-barrel domain